MLWFDTFIEFMLSLAHIVYCLNVRSMTLSFQELCSLENMINGINSVRKDL